MHEHIPAILTAAHHAHQTVKYYPITAKDTKTAEQGGIFAGIVAGVLILSSLARGRSRTPVTSK